MRNTTRTLLAGCLAIGIATPSAFAATSASSRVVETVHGWVSVHTQAKLSSPIVGRLQLGDKAPLIAKSNAYWYEIKLNGRDVYITTNTKFTKVEATKTSAQTSNQTVVETNHGWVAYHTSAKLSSPVVGKLVLGQAAPLVSKANKYWYEIAVGGNDVYITTNTSFTHLVTGNRTTSTTAGTSSSGTSTNTGSGSNASSGWQVQADKLISTAKTQLGVPYLWGHQSPGVGFDCSNFTAWSYRKALGISFSGSSVTQRNSVGTPVRLSNIREGDLLFFKTKNNATGGGHVGIYMGNGQVIQEGGGWGKVTIEPLQGTWLGRNLVFARRVIGN